MKHSVLVLADGVIAGVFGLFLLLFYPYAVMWFGLPETTDLFYPSLLGIILIGAGVALTIEYIRGSGIIPVIEPDGLVVMTFIGALGLAGLLIFGDLMLPIRGLVFLWALVAIFAVISVGDIYWHVTHKSL